MPPSVHESPGVLRAIRVADDLELRYRIWPATAGEPQGTLVLLNGIMSHSAWFEPIVPRLRHLHVVGADRRGSGANLEARGDAASAGRLVDDILAVIDVEHEAARPLFLLGWCWGAALAVVVASALEGRLAGLVLVTPGLCPSEAVARAIAGQIGRMTAARPEDAIVQVPIREEMFTEGPALERFILRDEARVRWMTPRMTAVSRKLATAARGRLARLDVPSLLVLASDDEATDNQATLRAFERYGPGHLETIVLRGKHGLQFDAPEALSRHLCAFIERVRGS